MTEVFECTKNCLVTEIESLLESGFDKTHATIVLLYCKYLHLCDKKLLSSPVDVAFCVR